MSSKIINIDKQSEMKTMRQVQQLRMFSRYDKNTRYNQRVDRLLGRQQIIGGDKSQDNDKSKLKQKIKLFYFQELLQRVGRQSKGFKANAEMEKGLNEQQSELSKSLREGDRNRYQSIEQRIKQQKKRGRSLMDEKKQWGKRQIKQKQCQLLHYKKQRHDNRVKELKYIGFKKQYYQFAKIYQVKRDKQIERRSQLEKLLKNKGVLKELEKQYVEVKFNTNIFRIRELKDYYTA